MFVKMSKIMNLTFFRSVFLQQSINKYGQILHRTFLSNAFHCQEVWNARLKTPILQKVEFDRMYHELNKYYDKTKNISAVDVDIFTNAVQNEIHVEELLDLVHKLRLSADTSNALPSTEHAVIRCLSDFGQYNRLLDVLDDRLNYGVFIDYYTASLLLDTFWKNKDYASGARIAGQLMLQEDFSEPFLTYLSLLHCCQFLKDPQSWTERPPPEEPEEEIKIRVKYLKNPFFDDHFDLKNPLQIVGKTMVMASTNLDNSLGRTFQLIGNVLYNKQEKAKAYLNEFKTKNDSIVIEALKLLPENDEIRLKANELQNDDLNVEETLIEMVKVAERNFAEKIISDQCKKYENWVQLREEALQKQVKRLDVKQRLTNIEESQSKLKQKEMKLWFFDREEQMELDIEAKKVYYPKRWFGRKKTPRKIDESYVPPELKPVYGKKK